MASPAILLIVMFLILPFFMAFGLAFTNQRLVSLNPTEFVGIRNFERMLGLNVLLVQPERNDQGSLILDQQGQPGHTRGSGSLPVTILNIPISTASVNG